MAIVVALCLCGQGASATMPRQTFSTEVKGVRLDVTVREANGVVAGLTAGNFEVLDNGTQQSCSVVETKDAPLDVVLVVQPVPMPRPDQLSAANAAASAVGATLKPQDRVGVILASAGPAVVRALAPVDPALESLQIPVDVPDAAVRDALVAAFLQFGNADRRKVVIVLTDGRHDVSWTTPKAIVAAGLHQPAEIVIALLDTTVSGGLETVESSQGPTGTRTTTTAFIPGAIGFRMPPPSYWGDLARTTGGQVVDLRNGDAGARLTGLMTTLRSEYVVTYTPIGVTPGGWHEVRVNLKGHKGTVVTRSGYYGGSEPATAR